MADVNYPAILQGPYYMVWYELHEGDDSPYSSKLYGDRGEAQRVLAQCRNSLPARTPDGYTPFAYILDYDEVYVARCGECGDTADHPTLRYLEWWGLCADVRSRPGWGVTSECDVFCPQHLLDNL